jgi:hypothetical protein
LYFGFPIARLFSQNSEADIESYLSERLKDKVNVETEVGYNLLGENGWESFGTADLYISPAAFSCNYPFGVIQVKKDEGEYSFIQRGNAPIDTVEQGSEMERSAVESSGGYFRTVEAGATSSGLENLANQIKSDFLETIVSGVEKKKSRKRNIELAQNYPNPFNAVTSIDYELENPSRVKISVYDAGGRRVENLVDEMQEAGRHSAVFSPEKIGLPSGTYFYILENGESQTERKKMLYLK